MSPDDGKFYGMVVAAIPGLDVTCVMPAEMILSSIQKRWQDARQELSDLLPTEAISAEEILTTSFSRSHVPDSSNSLLSGTGSEKVQDDHSVSAELVPHHKKPVDPPEPISELTTEIQVLQEKLNTVNEEVQQLEKQLRTANDLHNIAKQAVTRLEQDKEDLKNRVSTAENNLGDLEATLNSRLDSLRAEKSELERVSSIRISEAASQATRLRLEIDGLKTQALARESGLLGPPFSASTESINSRSRPGADCDFWIPENGILRDVLEHEITRFLGNNALIRPGFCRDDVRLRT